MRWSTENEGKWKAGETGRGESEECNALRVVHALRNASAWVVCRSPLYRFLTRGEREVGEQTVVSDEDRTKFTLTLFEEEFVLEKVRSSFHGKRKG